MTNKEVCKIFADAISASQRNHPIWKDVERRTITFTNELRNAMTTVMKYIWCQSVKFGSYNCQTTTKDGIPVDYCLEGEVMQLRNKGIETIGCCCGHGVAQGYIQVAPEFTEHMKALGYERIPIDEHGNGEWCFIPKTVLPKRGGKKVLIHECSAPNSWGSEQWALRESELSDVIPERKKQLEAREAQEQSNDDERA
ncbi:hypothetical protein [Christensenella intestinihominis]|uniref:hypothetical protein n=1 Tax=Christensenella intestinihominis TaxID=1851429 RepID=UPI00083427B3|nr:hypothetical protein [Christensenella intestinihominis]